MGTPENKLILVKDPLDGSTRPAFLVLTGQARSDFTFYVRNDRDEDILRRILQKESGRAGRPEPPDADGGASADKGTSAPGAAQAAAASPGQDSSFSCRINVLHPLLDEDDFKWEERGGEKKLVILQRLRRAKKGKAGGGPYDALRRALGEPTHAALTRSVCSDEELLKDLAAELNGLLARDFAGKWFNKSLSVDDEYLMGQIKDPAARAVLGNYLRFCSLFQDAIEPTPSRLRIGRVLAGLSYEGKCWSISFRKQERGTGYAPRQEPDGNLNSIEELCWTLYEEIFYAVSRSEASRRGGRESPAARPGRRSAEEGRSEEAAPSRSYRDKLREHRDVPLPELGGLVVVAGSTNSAKSLITRGLIHLYLKNVLRCGLKRRPHMVTFEDPIEKYFVGATHTSGDEDARPDAAPRSPEGLIDYTPRQQGIDTSDLRAALHDALRQTPKVFFVGETRRNEDWRELIDFAGTGHLVITTAHAGSLIEAMHKILLAAKARTPADRSEVASRLLAVVQLKRTEVAGFEKYGGVLVPAVWRRVPRGVNSLTAEGLASILPYSHSSEDYPCSSLGRKYFAERSLELADACRADADFMAALRAKAIAWDLQGV